MFVSKRQVFLMGMPASSLTPNSHPSTRKSKRQQSKKAKHQRIAPSLRRSRPLENSKTTGLLQKDLEHLNEAKEHGPAVSSGLHQALKRL